MKKRFLTIVSMATLLLSGCGGTKQIGYDDIMKNVSSAEIYSSSSTTAITAKGNMAFKNMTDAVIKDLENARDTYGIDFTYGVDGQLDIMLVSSLISDGKVSYSNNFNTQNFSSSQASVESLVNSYLDTHTSKSEAYVDLTTGVAMAKIDDDEEWTEIPADSGMDNSLVTTDELLPVINLVADTVGRDRAVITKTENGYLMDYDLALNHDVLSKVPQEYRDMIEKDGISYDNILSVFEGIDSGSYSFPIHMTVTFLDQGNGQYLINDITVSGEMILSFDKDFDELKEMGLGANVQMDADYSFGISGNVTVNLEYKNNLGFTPMDMGLNYDSTAVTEVK